MKNYPIKPTKKQLKIIKEGWKRFCRDQDRFYADIQIIEKWMQRKTGIKGIEFFRADYGDWVGVGTVDRDMALIQLDPV